MKRVVSAAVTLLIVVSLLVGVFGCAKAPPAPAPSPVPTLTKKDWPKSIRLIGGTPGRTYYLFAAGFAGILSKYLGIEVSAGAGGFSVDNTKLLIDKEGDTAFLMTDTIRAAWKAESPFKEKHPELRLIHTAFDGICHTVARAEAGIKTPYDLAGKKWIAIFPTTLIMQKAADAIMKEYGLEGKVTLLKFTSATAAAQSFQEKTADALNTPGDVPTSDVIELATLVSLNFLPIDRDKLERIRTTWPDLSPCTIPAGTYKGQDKDVLQIGWKGNWVTRADLPDDLVYQMLKTLFEHNDEVMAVHQVPGRTFKKERVFEGTMEAPFHAGAVRYYKELGVWTPTIEAFQKAKLAEAGMAK